jgi:hypothetical protein
VISTLRLLCIDNCSVLLDSAAEATGVGWAEIASECAQLPSLNRGHLSRESLALICSDREFGHNRTAGLKKSRDPTLPLGAAQFVKRRRRVAMAGVGWKAPACMPCVEAAPAVVVQKERPSFAGEAGPPKFRARCLSTLVAISCSPPHEHTTGCPAKVRNIPMSITLLRGASSYRSSSGHAWLLLSPGL